MVRALANTWGAIKYLAQATIEGDKKIGRDGYHKEAGN